MEQINQPVRLSLRDVLFVVFCKSHVFVGTFLTVVVLTVGISLVVPPVYEVSATILVKPFIDAGLQLQTRDGIRAMPVGVEEINSEVNIMKSEELLRKVVVLIGPGGEGPKPMFTVVVKAILGGLRETLIWLGISTRPAPIDAAVKRLQEDLEIEPVTASTNIRISLRGTEPARITHIMNTYVESYIVHHIDVHKAKGGLEFFSRQAALFSEKLEESEEELKAFQSKWGLIEIDIQRAENMELLKILRETLSQVRGKIAEEGTKLSQLRQSMGSDPHGAAMTKELRSSAAIIELTRALVPLLVEKERIALLYPETSVEYQDAMDQAKKFQEEVSKVQSRILEGIAFDHNALLSHEQTLLKETNRISGESLFLTEKASERDRLVREVTQNEKNAILYRDKMEEARINEQKDEARVANVTVSSYPHVPSMPVFPKKVLMGLASLILGLMAGVGCSFASYYLDHTVKRPEDLEQHCQLHALASLPEVVTVVPENNLKAGGV